MEVIDGEEVAADVRREVAREIEALGWSPRLVAVLMSDDPASETYVRMKHRAADEVGVDSETIEIDPGEPESKLLDTVADLNDDDSVDGVLVQLPLPDHVDGNAALDAVSPDKDVDGFHPVNKGLLLDGRPRVVPATPRGVHRLLLEADVEIEGADVTVVGRSEIVGKPLAALLTNHDATVTVCHSRTEDLASHTRRADVVVAAVGVPEMVTADMVGEGAVVIDVGVNRVDADNERGYELVGDVDFDGVSQVAGAVTPVPGGVGPMTVASLMQNTVELARRRRG
ncbi:MAG: bifunctional 5,10-methylenetetrahydrofolate dehydrogenase/5,10-methenyltetrahydrofolate cyclohydrolase [Halobacteriales archaeon]